MRGSRRQLAPHRGVGIPTGRREPSKSVSGCKAEIPLKNKVLYETGLDLVLVEGGLVTRNEVYFGRSGLLVAMGK